MTEDCLLLSFDGGLFWAHNRLWLTEPECLFSPKGTLNRATWGAENGTQETLK
jgi:hypothetical protein